MWISCDRKCLHLIKFSHAHIQPKKKWEMIDYWLVVSDFVDPVSRKLQMQPIVTNRLYWTIIIYKCDRTHLLYTHTTKKKKKNKVH